MANFKGLDDTNKATVRATVVNAQRSAIANGTVTVIATVSSIDGIPVDLLDEIQVYFGSINGVGTGTINLFLQRAIRPGADPAVDADWEDFYTTPNITVGAPINRVVVLPANRDSGVDVASASHVRSHAGGAADVLLVGHWGDKIRIVEKVTVAGLTTGIDYSVYMSGVRRQ